LAKSRDDEFNNILVAGVALGVGVLLGQVLQNTAKAHPDLGLAFGFYDFASSQNKKDESSTPIKGPEGHKCSGHCQGPCSNAQCLDSVCGQLISCHTHTPTTTTTKPNPQHKTPEELNKPCSGKCKSHTCDSQGFCIDDKCGAVIRSDSCKKRQRKPTSIIPLPYPGQPGNTDIGGGLGPSPSGPSDPSTLNITTPSGNLPDNSDQSQLPTYNTNESTMPDDQRSQEQPFRAQPPTSSRRVKTPAGQQQASTSPAPLTPSTPSTALSTGKLDNFKVAKIYDDDTNKSQYDWYLPFSNPNADSHVQNPEAGSHMPKLTPLGNGVYNISNNNEVRYAISNGFDAKTISACTPTVQQRGYMQSSSDFKDIEMTAYYRINKLGGGTKNGGPHLEHLMRGQRSTSDTTSYGGCSASCADNYHANYYPNGRQKFEKDMDHKTNYPHGPKNAEKPGATSAWNLGRWFGYKTIAINKSRGVELQTWTDFNGDGNWVRTHSIMDNNDWPLADASTVSSHCKTPTNSSPAITWGGPISVFRSDFIDSYDMKWASIRNIDASKPLMAAAYAYAGDTDIIPSNVSSYAGYGQYGHYNPDLTVYADPGRPSRRVYSGPLGYIDVPTPVIKRYYRC
jgi:hypothetical protein